MELLQKQAEPRDPVNPERRAFTVQSLMAMLAGVTITITGTGCGGGSSPTSPNPGNGTMGSVTVNHGHTAVVTSAQLMAGNAVLLDIRGTATHPHAVELSAAEVDQIAGRQRVSKTSSTEDSPDAGRHNHVVTFN